MNYCCDCYFNDDCKVISWDPQAYLTRGKFAGWGCVNETMLGVFRRSGWTGDDAVFNWGTRYCCDWNESNYFAYSVWDFWNPKRGNLRFQRSTFQKVQGTAIFSIYPFPTNAETYFKYNGTRKIKSHLHLRLNTPDVV